MMGYECPRCKEVGLQVFLRAYGFDEDNRLVWYCPVCDTKSRIPEVTGDE